METIERYGGMNESIETIDRSSESVDNEVDIDRMQSIEEREVITSTMMELEKLREEIQPLESSLDNTLGNNEDVWDDLSNEEFQETIDDIDDSRFSDMNGFEEGVMNFGRHFSQRLSERQKNYEWEQENKDKINSPDYVWCYRGEENKDNIPEYAKYQNGEYGNFLVKREDFENELREFDVTKISSKGIADYFMKLYIANGESSEKTVLNLYNIMGRENIARLGEIWKNTIDKKQDSLPNALDTLRNNGMEQLIHELLKFVENFGDFEESVIDDTIEVSKSPVGVDVLGRDIQDPQRGQKLVENATSKKSIEEIREKISYLEQQRVDGMDIFLEKIEDKNEEFHSLILENEGLRSDIGQIFQNIEKEDDPDKISVLVAEGLMRAFDDNLPPNKLNDFMDESENLVFGRNVKSFGNIVADSQRQADNTNQEINRKLLSYHDNYENHILQEKNGSDESDELEQLEEEMQELQETQEELEETQERIENRQENYEKVYENLEDDEFVKEVQEYYNQGYSATNIHKNMSEKSDSNETNKNTNQNKTTSQSTNNNGPVNNETATVGSFSYNGNTATFSSKEGEKEIEVEGYSLVDLNKNLLLEHLKDFGFENIDGINGNVDDFFDKLGVRIYNELSEDDIQTFIKYLGRIIYEKIEGEYETSNKNLQNIKKEIIKSPYEGLNKFFEYCRENTHILYELGLIDRVENILDLSDIPTFEGSIENFYKNK
ncbi:hypothetical protein [Candidatus Absconditicoccus praedator]|uniref:hypothetical protein n=1 Tax=Candidatus Absconditicoccus praedator TaxID=2735562 RepID=UPI001E5DE143|nr:hypothetical protein [Candidatus Absconditicoccus praedator]UFX82663.1 hypothetical protein HLG78_00735 [Candidatus Absconditicoccus praedator]